MIGEQMTTEQIIDKKQIQMYDDLWKKNGSDYMIEKLIEEMGGFTRDIIATRHNNVTYSRAVFEGMARVEVYMDILRVQLCKFPRTNGGCLYNDVVEIKEKINIELYNTLSKEQPPIIKNCPYGKRETDIGCPCEEDEELQSCEKLDEDGTPPKFLTIQP